MAALALCKARGLRLCDLRLLKSANVLVEHSPGAQCRSFQESSLMIGTQFMI